MRNPIKVLDRLTSERIAAGEVVERPLSVIKELVENSIDAGATSIAVELKDSGFSEIKVTDNGCGISAEELPLSIQRFATSKIASFDEISELSSLGFRGEALPSIASVSKMELLSGQVASECANLLRVEAGEVVEIRPAAAFEGTVVTVRDLFFNTPARKKFQKSASYELSQISKFISDIAVAHDDIRFLFKNGNRTILNVGLNMDRRDRLLYLWHIEDKKSILDFNDGDSKITLSGFVASAELSRSNRNDIILFVNGRYIRNFQLLQAVVDAYSPFLQPKKYPLTFLSISMPPSETDINVHPSKIEIKFTEPQHLNSLIRYTIHEAVKRFLTPAAYNEKSEPLKYDLETGEVLPNISESTSNYSSYHRPTPRVPLSGVHAVMDAVGSVKELQLPLPEIQAPKFKPIAQLYNTFIVGTVGESMVVIDQHAAHEKIIYEELKHASESKPRQLQPLLFPSVVELPKEYAALLIENLNLFASLEIAVEHFGESSFRIRELPWFLEGVELTKFFIEILDSLIAEQPPQYEDRLEKIQHMTACKAAVKAYRELSDREMCELYEKLMTLDEPFFCPHGRPVMKQLDFQFFEKLFKRS